MSTPNVSSHRSTTIVAVEAYRLQQPLIEPYHLSFGTFDSFDTFLVRAIAESGEESWGETTACEGYVPESGDEIWSFLRRRSPELIGLSPEAAIAALLPGAERRPFATTPLLTALEEIAWPAAPSAEAVVPLVGILSAQDEAELEAGFWTQVERGHSTIKVKVGFDLEKDLKRADFVQGLARQASGVKIRIDANQGYRLPEAKRFAGHLDPQVVELFEQPFDPDDWDSQVALVSESPVPLMLDESIRSIADVRKAAALQCCQYVKFKLMKAGSARRLAEEIDLARQLGLRVVLGNGVAGEVGCYQEAGVAVAAGLETPGEMNGFLKVRQSVLSEPLAVWRGGVVVRPDLRPTPALEPLASMAGGKLACWAKNMLT